MGCGSSVATNPHEPHVVERVSANNSRHRNSRNSRNSNNNNNNNNNNNRHTISRNNNNNSNNTNNTVDNNNYDWPPRIRAYSHHRDPNSVNKNNNNNHNNNINNSSYELDEHDAARDSLSDIDDPYNPVAPGERCTGCDHVEVCACVPQVYLNHAIGLDEEKGKIKEVLDTFVYNFDDFQDVGMTPPKGILLHGHTGCGKSLLAEAFACKYALSFVSVHTADLDASLVDRVIAEVDASVPCVVLIKHIDFPRRAFNKKELKLCLETFMRHTLDTQKRVFVFGTAFKRMDVDPSYLRADRLETSVHVPKPNKEARLIRLRSLLCSQRNANLNYDGLDYVKVADLMQGLTHTDVLKICDIAFGNLRVTTPDGVEGKVTITKDDMLRAITEYCSIIRKDAMIDSPD